MSYQWIPILHSALAEQARIMVNYVADGSWCIMSHPIPEDEASCVQTMDGMTSVVVARLMDSEGPCSGVARFTLPSYTPVHNFEAYETTWIVVLNRFHISLRTDNTFERGTSNTSDLQEECPAETTLPMPEVLCEPTTYDRITTARPRSDSATTSPELSCYQDDTVTSRPRSKSLTPSLEASCEQDDTEVQRENEPDEDHDAVQDTEHSQELHEDCTIHSAEDHDGSTDDELDQGTNGDPRLARDGAVSRIGFRHDEEINGTNDEADKEEDEITSSQRGNLSILEYGTPNDAWLSKLADQELQKTEPGSVTSEGNHSLLSKSSTQPRTVSGSSQESDNVATPPSTAPTTPLIMAHPSLKPLPPGDIKSCKRPIAVRLPATPKSIFYGQHSRLIGYGYSSSHVSGAMALPPIIRTRDAPSAINAEVQKSVNSHVRKNRRRRRKNNHSIVVNLPVPWVVCPGDSVAAATEQHATVGEAGIPNDEKHEELPVSIPEIPLVSTVLARHDETAFKIPSSKNDLSGIDLQLPDSSETQVEEAILPLPLDVAVPDVTEVNPNPKESVSEASTHITLTQYQLIHSLDPKSEDSTQPLDSLQTVVELLDDDAAADCEETAGTSRRCNSTPLIIATLPAIRTDHVDHDKQLQSREATSDVSLPLKNITTTDAGPIHLGAEPVLTIYQDGGFNDLENQSVGQAVDGRPHPGLILCESTHNALSLGETTASKQVMQTNRLASIPEEPCQNADMPPGNYEVVKPDLDAQSSQIDSSTSASDVIYREEESGEPFSDQEVQLNADDIEALERSTNDSDDDADSTSALSPVHLTNGVLAPQHAAVESSEATGSTERVMSAEAFQATLRLETGDSDDCLSAPTKGHSPSSLHLRPLPQDQESINDHILVSEFRDEDLSSIAGNDAMAMADEHFGAALAIEAIREATNPDHDTTIQCSLQDDNADSAKSVPSPKAQTIEPGETDEAILEVQLSNSVETTLSPDGAETEVDSVTPPLPHDMVSDQPENAKPSSTSARRGSERTGTSFQTAVSSLLKAPQPTTDTTVIDVEGLIVTPPKADLGTAASVNISTCLPSQARCSHPKPARIASGNKAESPATTGSTIMNCLLYGSIASYVGYKAWKAFKR